MIVLLPNVPHRPLPRSPPRLPAYSYLAHPGIAYGSFNALPPTLVSEMFGQKNFASIYAINSLAGAAASIGVASQMAGALCEAVSALTRWNSR